MQPTASFSTPRPRSGAARRLRFARALAVLAFALSSADADALERHPWNEDVPFESATIRYEIDGTNKGQQTLYLRAWGDERAKLTQTTNPAVPFEAPRSSIELVTPRALLRADLATRTAVEMPNPEGALVEAWSALPGTRREEERTKARRLESRFPTLAGRPELASKTDFLGFRCDVVRVGGVTSTYIEGTTILLKSEGTQGDFVSRTVAVSVDTTSPVDDSVFRLLEGIAVRTMSEALVAATRAQAERRLSASGAASTNP